MATKKTSTKTAELKAKLKLDLEKIFGRYINTSAVEWSEKSHLLQVSFDETVTFDHLKKLSRLLSSNDISFTAEAEVYGGCGEGCCSPEAEKSICITIMNAVYPKK